MTVCVAALAAESRVIVCVSDKALSYGDAIQWDSDEGKLMPLQPSEAAVLFAGMEEGTSRILGAILSREAELGEDKSKTKKILEDEYSQAVDELVERKYLSPRLIKRDQYIAAISGTQINPYMKAIAEEIDKFDMNCALLVCGKDKNNRAYILDVYHPGVVTDMTKTGFHAIGSGAEKAIARLLYSEHKRTHSVQRVLYDVFDAKAFAEMSAGVGYEWDASVVISRPMGIVPISEKIKDLVERAWAHNNRSPFESYDKNKHMKPPPKNWKKQLEKRINDEVLIKIKMEQAQEARQRSASRKSKGQP